MATQPTPNSVFIDPLLSDVAVAYMQSADRFISSKVFPSVPVQYPHGKYDIYDRDSWYRIAAKPRGPAEESAGSGYTLRQGTYNVPVEAVHKDLDAQTVASAMPPEDPRRNSTRWVTLQLLLRKEQKWAQAFFKSGVWSTDVTGVTGSSPGASQVTRWNDHTNSQPIEDVDNYMTVIEQSTGYTPNTLVLGKQVFIDLKNHPEILDRIKYTQTGVLTEQIIAEVFGVEQVLVARAIYEPQAETTSPSTVPMTDYQFLVSSTSALLCYAAPAPSIEEPSGGYHFNWTGYLGASAEGSVVYEIPVPLKKAVRIEGELATAPTIVAPDLGVMFNGVHI